MSENYGIIESLPFTVKHCHVCNNNHFWHYTKTSSIVCKYCACLVDPKQHYNPATPPSGMVFVMHPDNTGLTLLDIRKEALKQYIKYTKGEKWQLLHSPDKI